MEDYKFYGKVLSLDSIEFKDTLNGFVTDSLTHNLGNVPNIDCELIKYFKYEGQDTAYISRSWTGDPHFICRFPREPLVKGKIYFFSVCFSFEIRYGKFQKQMGFFLTNGQRITFTFKGNIVAPIISEDGK